MPRQTDQIMAQLMEALSPEEIEAFSREEQAEIDRIMKEVSSARL